MSIILAERLIYLHKGLFVDQWKESTFVLYSNGTLCKQDELGKNRETIDLKKVFKQIKVYSLSEYRSQVAERKENEGFCLVKKNLALNQLKPEPSDAIFMSVPFRPHSSKACTILFEKHDKLDDWLKNINKWASIPKIQVEYITLSEKENNCQIDVK